MKIKEFDAATGKELIREANEAEISQREKDALESQAKASVEAKKSSAKAALLEKLGITAEEAKLLLS